jgi:hypothetical protein
MLKKTKTSNKYSNDYPTPPTTTATDFVEPDEQKKKKLIFFTLDSA